MTLESLAQPSGLSFPRPAILASVLAAVVTAFGCGDGGIEPSSSSGELDGSIAYVLEARGEEPGTGSHHVVVRTLATGEEQVVLSLDWPAAYVGHLTWSRDGNSIVLGLHAPIDEKRWDAWLARYSPDGSGGERVFDTEGHERLPAYSWDGRLAYHWDTFGDNPAALFVDGTFVVSVWSSDPPAWLPGGEAVLVSSPRTGIVRVEVPSGEITTIIPDQGEISRVNQPNVSSTGRIAFIRSDSQDIDIWIAESDGSRARRIIRNGHTPVWSPDGKHLVYTRDWTETRVFTVDFGTDQLLFRTRHGEYSGHFVWLPSSL